MARKLAVEKTAKARRTLRVGCGSLRSLCGFLSAMLFTFSFSQCTQRDFLFVKYGGEACHREKTKKKRSEVLVS